MIKRVEPEKIEQERDDNNRDFCGDIFGAYRKSQYTRVEIQYGA